MIAITILSHYSPPGTHSCFILSYKRQFGHTQHYVDIRVVTETQPNSQGKKKDFKYTVCNNLPLRINSESNVTKYVRRGINVFKPSSQIITANCHGYQLRKYYVDEEKESSKNEAIFTLSSA